MPEYWLPKGRPGSSEWFRLDALRFACSVSDLDIIKLLIENGADVDSLDDKGWSILMQAADEGNAASIKILLENGVNKEIRNLAHESALSIALRARPADIVAALKEIRTSDQATRNKLDANRFSLVTSLFNIISNPTVYLLHGDDYLVAQLRQGLSLPPPPATAERSRHGGNDTALSRLRQPHREAGESKAGIKGCEPFPAPDAFPHFHSRPLFVHKTGRIFVNLKTGTFSGHKCTPRACPSFKALFTFTAKNVSSIDITSG